MTSAPASEATPGQPPFVKWLSDARQLHPDVPTPNLAQRYLRQYGKADPSTLPSWQEFFPQARVNNPGVHKADLKGYWSSVYGAVGASEKAPEKAPRFMEGVIRGAKAGAAALGESVAGAAEFLLPRAHPFQEIAKGAGDAMRAEAEKLAPAPELAEQPWYQRLTNPHYLGQLLGDMAVETAPSLGAFGAGAIAGSAGGPVGALVGGTAAMAGTIFLQQAGSVFREASDRYQQAGLPRAEAEQRAFRDAGLAGFVSGAVNSVGVPASLVAPFRRTLVNLVVQYGLNVGVDTADQITQNILAQHAYAPERELTEGVPEAAAGSALLSSPQTLIAAKVARRLGATTAVPSTTVPQAAAAPVTPTTETTPSRAPATDPLAGILRQPTVEGAIDQAERSLQAPLVTTDALDRAIAGAARLDTLHSGAPTAARAPVAPELDAEIRQAIEAETPTARSTIEAETARRVQEERQQAPTAELTPSETELAQVWRTYQEAQTPEARAAILERAAPATRSYMQEVAARGGAPLEAPRAGAAERAPRQVPAAPQLHFNGVQYGLSNEPGIELWTLHSPYPGLREGSTYSRQTLEQAGVAVPVAPVEAARMPRAMTPAEVAARKAEILRQPETGGAPADSPIPVDRAIERLVEASRPVHEETPVRRAESPEQIRMPVPPETVGARPIVGREATPAEAPLFSKQAQTEEPEQPAVFEPRAESYNARAPRYVVQPIPPQGVFGERYQVMDRVDGRPMSRVPSSSRETAEEIADHLNAGGELMEPTAPYAAMAPVWYSHVVRVLEQKMPARASADHVRGILTPANGVKPGELKWTGLDEYLKTKEDFTKSEILDYLRQNHVEISEAPPRLARYEAFTLPGGTNYQEMLLKLPISKGRLYQSPHWSEPNVLAHVRMDDRTTRDGKRVLFLEEIQSDWHQKGRKVGYKTVASDRMRNFHSFGLDRGLTQEQIDAAWRNPADPTYSAWQQEHREAINELSRVAAAPFEKTWPELVLKRMLRYAAEHGYDELAWTTGEQQAERYDLTKQVSRLGVARNDDGTFGIDAETTGGMVTIGTNIPESKLPEYVGKDLAQNIVGQRYDYTVYSGLDLKVGDAGMKSFYDHTLPQFLNTYAKKWGARVRNVEIGHGETAANVHSLPITEAMRRSVLTEGQALFERRSPYGRTLRPEADPARSRQLTLDALGDLDRAVEGVSTTRGAVASEGSGVRTVGLGIRRDLIRTGRIDLRGLVARSPEDIATIGQVFRDPRFETLRYLYMKGDQIVGHEAVTSRLPGLTYAFLKRPGQPVNIARALYEMRDRMRRLGADGYYLMHNHPSGSPVPSPEDVSLTRRLASEVPGFRGHIVVNSGTYGLIEATGARIAKPQVRILPTAPSIDLLLQAAQPHPTINHPIASADDVASLGKQLQSSDRYVAILYRSANGRVRAAQEMPVGLFTRPTQATDYLRGRAREFGAPQAFAYYQGEDPSIQHAARALIQRGALRDFVSGGGHSTVTAPDLVASEGQTFGRSIDALVSTRVAETKAPDVVPPTAAPEPVEADVTFAPVGVLDHAIRTWLDQFVDVRRVVEGLKAAGRTIADEFNPVYREEAFLGRVAHETKSFLSDELLPLTQAMRLAKVSQADLDQYLHARHAQEANAVLQARNPDLPNNASLSGMTNAEADRILTDAPPSLEPLAKRVDAIVGRTRALMVAYGLESPQTIHSWSTRYRYYVPLQRAGFEQEASRGTGRGRDIRGPSSRPRVGSAREVTNILANIAMQRERTIVRGEKMRPVTALAALLMRYPQPEIAQLSKPVPISYTDPQTGLTETAPGDVGDYRVPTIRTLNKQTGVVEVRPDPAYKGRDNVVNFRVGGQDYAIVFNEQNERARNMAQALKGMDIPSLNGLLQTVAPVTRFFASINTQYSPFFGIRNFLRDAGFASLSLSSTPLAGQRATVAKYAIESLRGIYAEARAVRQGQHAEGVAAKWWRRFDAAGGPTGYRDLYQSSTDRAQAIEQMLDPDWWMKTVGGKALTAAGTLPGPAKLAVDRAARPLFQWLSDYNLMMENSIRLGVFRTAVEHGLSDIRAASLAKNVTVNFNRKGIVTTQVGSLYAFFNASAQGSARVADTLFQAGTQGQLSRAGKAIVMGGIVLGVMQAAMLELAGFGDEEPPEWQRETNFVVPLPGTDRKYVSVPYPLGFNVLPNIGRLGTEAALHGHVTKHIYNFLGLAMDAFSPFGTAPTLSQVLSPTATDPLIALEENKDWRGRPIAREDHDALRPTPGHTRAKPGASAWGLALARGINWATGGNAYRRGIVSPTPDQIDYLIAQFTGGIGRELGRASRLATGAVRGEDIPLSTVPLLGQYVGSGASSQAIRDRFYQHIKELNQLEAEWKGRRADREPVTSFLKEHPEVRLAPYGRLTERTVSMLQKRKQEAISHDAPRAEVRRLDDLITTHMQRLNDRVQQATAQ